MKIELAPMVGCGQSQEDAREDRARPHDLRSNQSITAAADVPARCTRVDVCVHIPNVAVPTRVCGDHVVSFGLRPAAEP